MDEMAGLIVLVLAFPVMALVALILALRQRGRLKALEQRVHQLEAMLASARVPLPPAPLPAAEAALPEALPEAIPEPLPTGREDAPVARAARPRRWQVEDIRANLSGLEERVGARWTVWVGGLALALGGVFLVRFAVEQNLIGPTGRILLGLALAAALLAAGEALRRLDRRDGFAGLPAAQVPSVLTAVGTMTAFGSLYAAYELYHLLSPAVAFLLLGLTGVATLLAALLHGPALAALGFVGAAVTPMLISSDTPNAWGVVLLIAMVTASALAVARIRLWRWLALLALAGAAGWGVILLAFELPQAVPGAGTLALILLVLTAVLLAPGLAFGPPEDDRAAPPRPDLLTTLGCALALAVSVLAANEGLVAASPLTLFILTALGALALAWRVEAGAFAAVAVALAAPAILAAWAFPPEPGSAVAPAGPLAGVAPEPARLSVGHFAAYGVTMGALLAGLGIAGAGRARRGLFALGWAAAGTIGPVLLLIAAYGRLTELERSLPFAALALGLALLFTASSELFSRRRSDIPAAAFAAGAVVSLALALAFALERGWLTVGLALAALGVAWVSSQRPLPGLRQLAAGLGLVVLGRIGWEPTIAGADLGTTPIVNWLLWGYGVPALAFAGAARLLARRGDDWSRRVLESLALVFAVLLAAFEVRHLAHGPDVFALGSGLFESGLLAAIYTAYATGLARLAAISGRALYRIFSDLVAVLAALCALDALIEGNPFLTGAPVGGLVFNDLLVAYALPAGLALLYAAVLPLQRRRLRLAAAALSIVLALAYVTFQVSRLFQGPVLDADKISAMEWYSYSAAWLAFGIVLQGLALWRGSRSLRLGAAAVMVVTVLKVFLSDMSDLEGVLRALSFIGLGLVLVGMGWLYQRLLPRRAPPA